MKRALALLLLVAACETASTNVSAPVKEDAGIPPVLQDSDASVTADAAISEAEAGAPDAGVRKRLIKFGFDVPSPDFIKAHASEMAQMPFDGLILRTTSSLMVQRQSELAEASIQAELAPLTGVDLGRLRSNFMLLSATPVGGPFADWAIPIENYRRFARALRAAKMEGIFFDNEDYGAPVNGFPEACPGHTPAECQAQAHVRGREVMTAMVEEWPTMVLIAAFGPWVSEAATATALAGTITYADHSNATELLAPFLIGMLEASLGTTATVIDGGELYALRSQSQFERARRWMREELPTQSSLVPASLKASYPSGMGISFGVYDQPFDAPMDVVIWESTLRAALSTADRYVWAYTERYDWWGTGNPTTRAPAEWVAAARRVNE